MGSGALAGHLARANRLLSVMAAVYPQRMSVGLRSAVMLTFGALWLSGCYWLVLHYFFAQPSEFGPLQHPWGPVILRIDRKSVV